MPRPNRPSTEGGPVMVYVGIDLHRKSSQLCALDEHGEQLLSRRVVNEPEALLAALAQLPERPAVALEAAFGWEWLADLLESEGIELHLAHPLRTRAIAAARVKTDAVDARTLAELLRARLLPEAYVAPRELRQLRQLLRQRICLSSCAPRSRTASTRCSPARGSSDARRACSARPAALSWPACRCGRRSGPGSSSCSA